jgi:trafficking protein particle complex subunit 8
MKFTRPVSVRMTHLSYSFLSLLPTTESLAVRGRRLQETALQRQSVMYAPDIFIQTDVEETSHKLAVSFVDDDRLVLGQGECRSMTLWLTNAGTRSAGEIWMVAGDDDEVWVDTSGSDVSSEFYFPSQELVATLLGRSVSEPFKTYGGSTH